MTKVLSGGEFEQLFQQHFRGEQLLSVNAQGARESIPKAAEIDREAENSFNLIWEFIILEAVQASVSNYIVKPFNAATLQEKLNKIFPK